MKTDSQTNTLREMRAGSETARLTCICGKYGSLAAQPPASESRKTRAFAVSGPNTARSVKFAWGLGALALLTACGERPPSGALRYFRDDASGLCFAIGLVDGTHAGSHPVLAHVPCEAVLRLLPVSP